MKKQMASLIWALGLSGAFLMGCTSTSQDEEAAQQKLREAQEELVQAKEELAEARQRRATEEEWRAFKLETDERLIKNDNRIAELKIQIKKPGKTPDQVYVKQIDALEVKNKDLRTRLTVYERNQSDWESFKQDFNHEMEELGKAFSSFADGRK